jgi:hypothetical protein
MTTVNDKLNALLIDKIIASVRVMEVDCHGVICIEITTTDGTSVSFDSRERNGGGYIAVTTGDDLVD